MADRIVCSCVTCPKWGTWVVVTPQSEAGPGKGKFRASWPAGDCGKEFEFEASETRLFDVPLPLFERRRFSFAVNLGGYIMPAEPLKLSVVLQLWPRVEHVRYGRSMPCQSSPVDLDPVSFVQPLVAAFGLVCAVSEGKLQSFPALRDKYRALRYCE
jgi:hypothetical protein